MEGGHQLSTVTPSQEAVGVFRQRVSQFNGCVPYAGVSTSMRVDEAVLPVLFAMLPVPQPVGITVAPPSVKARAVPCSMLPFSSQHLIQLHRTCIDMHLPVLSTCL